MAASAAVPTVSVIIPVWHEAARITAQIEHVLEVARLSYPSQVMEGTSSSASAGFIHGVEIIVADGAPEADTIGALQAYLAEAENSTCAGADNIGEEPVAGVSAVTCLHSPQGRARQMNAGARVARGNILCFLHVDTMLPADGFAVMRRALTDSFAQVSGVQLFAMPPSRLQNRQNAGSDVRQPHAGAFSLAIDGGGPWLWLVEKLANWRNRLTKTPYGDQVQYFRTEYFRMLGGYSEIPLMEDVDIMRRIRHRGDSLAIVDETVRTSARRWEAEGQIYCSLRNICLRSLYGMGVSAQTLARWYRAFRERK